MSDTVRPFRLHVSDEAIADLHLRLERTRWPDEVNDAAWGYGVAKDYLRQLTGYWRNEFDWRAAESRINALPQYMTAIDGLDLHFVHCRSRHPDARPLLITHGWPGSIVEFLEVIPRLTDPERFGGTAARRLSRSCSITAGLWRFATVSSERHVTADDRATPRGFDVAARLQPICGAGR